MDLKTGERRIDVGTGEPGEKKKKGKIQVTQVGEEGKALWNSDCRDGL